jgi:hypothetical protein
MKCPHCGAPLGDSQPFCTNCGAPNPNTHSSTAGGGHETVTQPAKRESSAENNTAVIVTAIICAAAVAVFAMYFLVFKPKTAVQTSSGSSKTAQSESSDASSSNTSSSSNVSSGTSSRSSSSSSNSNWMNRSYIIPYSTTEYLSSSDIAGFSAKECNYALNEIYAREGRRFRSTELQNYFDSKSWYSGTIDPDYFDENAILSGVEQNNVEFLRDAMNARGGYTPQ